MKQTKTLKIHFYFWELKKIIAYLYYIINVYAIEIVKNDDREPT